MLALGRDLGRARLVLYLGVSCHTDSFGPSSLFRLLRISPFFFYLLVFQSLTMNIRGLERKMKTMLLYQICRTLYGSAGLYVFLF